MTQPAYMNVKDPEFPAEPLQAVDVFVFLR